MPIYEMCRICLAEDKSRNGMQPLFDKKNARCAEILTRIEECSGITLKLHAEFPKMICFTCLDSLNTSYKFRLMCQSSENTLLEAIVKSELNSELQESAVSSRLMIKHKSDGVDCVEEDDEMFYDLHSNFIEGEEVEFDDIADTKQDFSDNGEAGDEFFGVEEVDLEQIDGEEHLDDSDSETEAEGIVDDDEFIPIPKKKKSGADTKVVKNPKAKVIGKTGTGDKPAKGRGRKKKEAEPQTNICEICGNIYAKRSLLNMHMRRHRSEKPFECEICGKQFACPSEISRHIRIHTGEKPYVCRFCGRAFADISTNKKHERIHTNERPFTCQTCGKSFTYSNVLKNHILTHTGEKPFLCKPCNKTFSQKHQLDQHLSTITHQQTVKNLQIQDDEKYTLHITKPKPT